MRRQHILFHMSNKETKSQKNRLIDFHQIKPTQKFLINPQLIKHKNRNTTDYKTQLHVQ
jgi:hypothetical protein